MSSGKDIGDGVLAETSGAGSVVLAMPRRGQQVNFGAVEAYYRTPARKYTVAALVNPMSTLLTRSFNMAWAAALNMRDEMGAKYFGMLHDDIEPAQWWVDTLIDELLAHGADAISTVMPIKSHEGLTSTAVYEGDLWLPRRLTMREVMDLPETFGPEDVGGPLLLNTGCWVVDMTKPFADTMVFDFLNRIDTLPSGRRVAASVPEDWLASHHMNEHGAKLLATRKVKAVHNGSSDYPNSEAWGAWGRDELYYQRKAEKEAREPQCA